ncbi:MAG: 16S rRNA (cytidine(1402)-2'-O)-methyltransferase [Candidatus Omnitrophica bacterium]|jgi:16S rRNA (cytidine1402-2'-O)-methyltransferase|nr:16S rRNA (cytidine(1402)-2'-O)-methyltransferase [Candidatus Omnitrophota bacterium]MDD3987663.1 16S rRNA (cytidine(1402)-2'-O)-methyltransferase [Candidatus Omnitrophota bacterium]MDD4981380.1 16S rRNA (cytidine(1402)-2'-O)-methyltransferase [Candidatus Omnitrophota bacterium]MDD5664760.1 16S rRNA (cytidine(1402)-2'-O)-methyltransferase [Candidatus Omnitrophota bacterium]
MLYIVATPIGHLKDITLRAIEVLRAVDLIACEDTRHTKILLDAYDIRKPMTSFFQHNRFTKGEHILNLLKEGKDIALVCDAGMPGILDPGYNLINLVVKNSIELTVIPGATALINALVLSGSPAHEFYFAGFLPNKKTSRRNKLKALAKFKCTVVCYESCHRILASLEDIGDLYGEKAIVVARELTKKFEEAIRGSARGIIEKLKKQKPRGEFVIII